MYRNDSRVVMTLDAGGTNFTFSAIQANSEIVNPYSLPASPNDLDKCLDTLLYGFSEMKKMLQRQDEQAPVAISFAFPGPADYKNGIIGDLPNFPSFRGGVALAAFLEEEFDLPVFINNDGNLFAYGEALAGALPKLNQQLEEKGSDKRYKNLIGITFGTGFGSGVVIDGELLTGDNGCGGDVWTFRNKLYPDKLVEESVSIRAIVRVYNEISRSSDPTLTPKDIFDIAEGVKDGDRVAAIESFSQFGEAAGDAIAHLQIFADGIIVLGGGIIGAAKYIIPSLKKELCQKLNTFSGVSFDRVQPKVLDLAIEEERDEFFTDKSIDIQVPRSHKRIKYNVAKQTAILVSELDTSRAISLGSYAYALSELDKI